MSLLSIFDFVDKGGWVAWVLAILSGFLWYGIGYRYLLLKTNYVSQQPKDLLKNQELSDDDILGSAINKLQATDLTKLTDANSFVGFHYKMFLDSVSEQRALIKAIVIVAPLLGLLGTVIGMIETFESLQDSALFSQSGGIAGGISQALITTQMGLVVAIPGLLIGRKLDKQEQELTSHFEQVISLLQLRGENP